MPPQAPLRGHSQLHEAQRLRLAAARLVAGCAVRWGRAASPQRPAPHFPLRQAGLRLILELLCMRAASLGHLLHLGIQIVRCHIRPVLRGGRWRWHYALVVLDIVPGAQCVRTNGLLHPATCQGGQMRCKVALAHCYGRGAMPSGQCHLPVEDGPDVAAVDYAEVGHPGHAVGLEVCLWAAHMRTRDVRAVRHLERSGTADTARTVEPLLTLRATASPLIQCSCVLPQISHSYRHFLQGGVGIVLN